LPEKVVTIDPDSLPDQDRYDLDLHTGWIACTLTTSSPLYVRAALDQDEFERSLDQNAEKKRDWVDQVRNKPDFFYVDSYTKEPVIPGSSLRGMLRGMVEIVGFGKMQWVTDQQRYFFRAVAAARSDPLRDPYREIIGPFARNVQAGYLLKRGDKWYVLPALSPRSRGWPEKGAYLKVKEYLVKRGNIHGYIELDSEHYHPQLHEVSFDVEVERSKRGPYTKVTRIGPVEAGYAHQGMLVCSGNMLEVAKPGQKSPRRNHALVLMPDNRVKPLRIQPEAVQDYLAGLTPFQKEKLGAWGGSQRGCLKQGVPVFFVTEGKLVVGFGHSPNFRVAFRQPGGRRASSPQDYVPQRLRNEEDVDLAEAIFGYTKEKGKGKKRSYAGRVAITDARLQKGQDRGWLDDEPLVPRILGSPKPTTFQHYLVQTTPNQSANLAHYATETPEGTVIRGHKLYWHKGETDSRDVAEKEPEKCHDTQHTQIQPVPKGIAFDFRLYFENLSMAELGALLWVLDKAQNDDYRLKLGMGKPYGMGAVRIESNLHLTDRVQRYRRLFQDRNWAEGGSPKTDITAQALMAFEKLILDDHTLNPAGATSLEQVDRIQALLAMLSWSGPDAKQTRYLLIEHERNGNEYKNRPVLPDPLVLVAGRRVQPPPRPARPIPADIQPPRPQPATHVPAGFQQGTVKDFGLGRSASFGFIQPDDGGPDVFVHRSGLAANVKTLKRGDKVVYRRVQGPKGPKAEEVRLV